MSFSHFKASFALIAFISLLTATGGIVRADTTNLVANGNFETTTAIAQIGGPDNSDSRYAQVSGWTMPTGGVNNSYSFVFGHDGSGNTTADTTGSDSPEFNNSLILYGPGNGHANGLVSSPDGGNFLGMDGAFQNPGPDHGAISQQITGLVPGKSYYVTFYDAAAQQHGFSGATHDQWNVSLGDQTQKSTYYSLAEAGFSGWHQQHLLFKATSSTETLSFYADSGPSGTPPFGLLDGVQVQAAPLPSSLSMSLVGFVILGAFNMHRRNKRAGSQGVNVVEIAS